ncbi:hypothetical protein NL520_27720, partial [Klebsiella pneumoniae]|nr:hypothetical protein [Klebsiella pneumoniae]
ESKGGNADGENFHGGLLLPTGFSIQVDGDPLAVGSPKAGTGKSQRAAMNFMEVPSPFPPGVHQESRWSAFAMVVASAKIERARIRT